jgi:hypothetical protein
MHVLFICWFGRDVTFNGGWSAKHLHRLGFFKGDDHYMGRSFVQREQEGDDDWRYVYVKMYVLSRCYYCAAHSRNYLSMFVDRDMFMRFRGGVVSHKVTREWMTSCKVMEPQQRW